MASPPWPTPSDQENRYTDFRVIHQFLVVPQQLNENDIDKNALTQIRIRRREQSDGLCHHTLTVRKVENGQRLEIRRHISEREYDVRKSFVSCIYLY